MTPYPFGSVSSSFRGNYTSTETVALLGWSAKRAIAESVSSNFYVDVYFGSFGERNTPK